VILRTVLIPGTSRKIIFSKVEELVTEGGKSYGSLRSTTYIYNTEKFNCTCADDVFYIPSAKDAMTIPMRAEAHIRKVEPTKLFFVLCVLTEKKRSGEGIQLRNTYEKED
jgi:hypothetical protein